MVDAANETFGRIDILVNNAGWTGTTPALDVTEEEYDRTMAASFKSVFFACQAAARVMIPQGARQDRQHRLELRRRRVPGPRGVCGAKAGVHHLSRALSLEWAKQGVTVNVVAPCITETESRKVDSRAARLQGMGDHADAAGRPVESARGSRRRGAVSLQPSVRHGRRPRPDGGRRLDDPLAAAMSSSIFARARRTRLESARARGWRWP